MKGIIEYDINGDPKCEICGLYFKRVLSHVRQKHSMNEREYKLEYGFNLGKGICSTESSQLSRDRAYQNYDKVIKRNLEEKGAKNRFKPGDKGRTRDQLQLQALLQLKQHFNKISTYEQRVQHGKTLGHSGTGNKARWNK